jgi:hypothetical protein
MWSRELRVFILLSSYVVVDAFISRDVRKMEFVADRAYYCISREDATSETPLFLSSESFAPEESKRGR